MKRIQVLSIIALASMNLLFAQDSVAQRGRSSSELGAVYNWEPLLNYQFDFINQTHTTSILLSKTYYKTGSRSWYSVRSSRHWRRHGSRKIGLGFTAVKVDDWEYLPFVHFHYETPKAKAVRWTMDHRLYLDDGNKFAWNPRIGLEVNGIGICGGYGFTANTPALRTLDKWSFAISANISYHKIRAAIWRGKVRKQAFKERSAPEEEGDRAEDE